MQTSNPSGYRRHRWGVTSGSRHRIGPESYTSDFGGSQRGVLRIVSPTDLDAWPNDSMA